MASRKTVRAAAAQPSPVTTPQAQSTAAAMEPCPFALAVSLVLAASLVVTAGWSSAAHAQAAEGQTGSAPAAQAQADDVRQYDIPAGPLSEVLTRFSTESGIFLGGATDLAEGKGSPGLQGQYSVEQALRTLLAGSGLSYLFAGENRVTLVAAQAGDGPLRTGPILVAGDAASGAGPVEGFRAETSSSATNVDAPLIETPATVNVLTSDFLNAIQSRQFEDALAYVPGAGVQDKGFVLGTQFNLRGFEIANNPSNGGVFVDGLSASRRGYHFDRSLYERVDILKGTSAVLFGVAPPGGVVNYVRKKPQFESAYRIDAALGSFDLARSSFDATGAVGNSDTLAYRTVVTVNTGDQTVLGDVDGDGLEDDSVIFNPQLTWLPPGGGKLNLSYEYHDLNSPFVPGIKRLDSGQILFDRKNVASGNDYDSEQHIGTVEFNQPLLKGWELSLAAKIVRGDSDRTSDSTFFGPLGGSRSTRFTGRFLEDFEQEQYRAEINGSFFTGERIEHQLTAGFTYLRSLVVTDRSTAIENDAIDVFNPVFGPTPSLPAPEFAFTIQMDPEQRFYLQDYVSIGDKLSIFGGVSYVDFVGGNEFSDPEFPEDKGEDDAFVWNLGAIYNHSALLNPFASYATSLEFQRGLLRSGERVPSREGEQIEIGNKSEWFDGRLATSVSLFQVEQTNISEFDPDDPNFIFSILVGDQRTRGFEFEAVGDITEQIRIIGGYGYLDAEFTESTTGNQGNSPHSIPEHKFSLFGEYAFTGELRGWSAGLGFIHETGREGDNANTFELPDYERVDLTLAYQRGPFDFRASVENVFDENYIAGSAGNGNRLSQGAPRFFTLSAGYEF